MMVEDGIFMDKGGAHLFLFAYAFVVFTLCENYFISMHEPLRIVACNNFVLYVCC